MVMKGINKGDDLVSSLKVTYKVTADKAASAQRYLDDVFEQMRAGRIGNGKYQYGFAGGYMDESSLFIYEIYDDAGNTLSRVSRMDEIADPGVVKGLGGAGHPGGADYKPPYKPGTIVKEIELTENTTFVRVYDNMPDGSGMYGGWVMKAEDIEGLTPLEI